MHKPPSALIGMILSGLLVSAAMGVETVSDRSGSAVQGLRMSLAIARKEEAGSPEFQITFENVGHQDVTLNLGVMLANGKPLTGTALFPTNIRIHLTDVAGATRELRFLEPNVAGRVDDYVVPLRVGSTYTVKVALSKFWCPAGGEVPVKLTPGEVQASAGFHGGEAEHASGKFILNYWEGDLRSNAVAVKQ